MMLRSTIAALLVVAASIALAHARGVTGTEIVLGTGNLDPVIK